VTGGFIHGDDPFATPESERSPVRRLRGRLPAAVTLWTAIASDGGRAGLTVSSTLVVDGDPGRLLGLVDDEAAWWPAASTAGRFAVTVLGQAHRQLADRFAGLLPAPGGPFADHEWLDTPYGPVPADAGTWVGCRLDGSRPIGWALLVEATIERVELGVDPPLVHYRGRYRAIEAR